MRDKPDPRQNPILCESSSRHFTFRDPGQGVLVGRLRSADFKHAVERHSRPPLHAGTHLDAVDDAPLHQVFQRPRQVLRADAIHRGAEAPVIIEAENALALRGKTMCETIHQVNLRADCEGGIRRSIFYNLDQSLG